jgi:hypothetical protein
MGHLTAEHLTAEQRNRAIEVMREYLSAPPNADGKTPVEADIELDRNRVTLIDKELKPLVTDYLASRTPLSEFKSRIDGMNKRNEHWGFKGIKGQMFFNMIVNVSDDLNECDQELKASIALPANEDMARSRIKTFQSYVRRLGEEHVEAGGSKQGRPKEGSIPFFLSYFWQIQDRMTWPIFYTNSVNTMIDLNLWQPTDNLADDYVAFKSLHHELAELFTADRGRPFNLYEVEHVFWFKGGNPYAEGKPGTAIEKPAAPVTKSAVVTDAVSISRLPESFVPPIISILPRIALNETGLEGAAKASGTSLVKAFEKSINAAFTILGYDTKLMGQGMGRVPDGLALEHDNSYAILWDAKIRESGYSMGTDDRTIREYVMKQSRELKRRGSLRNIYYVVVSSAFKDDFDDLIRSLKMETDTNEVCLLEAAALVAMVDLKLRNPLGVSLGPDGLQRLFSSSGIVNAEDVQKLLV